MASYDHQQLTTWNRYGVCHCEAIATTDQLMQSSLKKWSKVCRVHLHPCVKVRRHHAAWEHPAYVKLTVPANLQAMITGKEQGKSQETWSTEYETLFVCGSHLINVKSPTIVQVDGGELTSVVTARDARNVMPQCGARSKSRYHVTGWRIDTPSFTLRQLYQIAFRHVIVA